MSGMEQDSPQSGAAPMMQQGPPQQQNADRPQPPSNLQDEARVASREALEAQQDAQEAIKRAYMKQTAAQEKAQQASQQVLAQQETAKKVASEAASQAAEKAASEQRELAERQRHETSVAQEAVHHALAVYSSNQPRDQPRPPTFSSQGFNPNAGGVQSGQFQSQGQPSGPALLQGLSQPMDQENSNSLQSGKMCQDMLLQAANQIGESAIAQMTAAQNLASGALDPHSQQVAKGQAEGAQRQMTMAQELAAAAQAPSTAVQAAAQLPNLLKMV